jgi:hypothetical protein
LCRDDPQLEHDAVARSSVPRPADLRFGDAGIGLVGMPTHRTQEFVDDRIGQKVGSEPQVGQLTMETLRPARSPAATTFLARSSTENCSVNWLNTRSFRTARTNSVTMAAMAERLLLKGPPAVQHQEVELRTAVNCTSITPTRSAA